MNGLWTEEECIILNHVASEAWTSEERHGVFGTWTEEHFASTFGSLALI